MLFTKNNDIVTDNDRDERERERNDIRKQIVEYMQDGNMSS